MPSKFDPYSEDFLPRPELKINDYIEREPKPIEGFHSVDRFARESEPIDGDFIPLSSIYSYPEYDLSPFGRKKEHLDDKFARHISVGDFDATFQNLRISDYFMPSKEAQLVATAVRMVKKASSIMDGDTAWVSEGVSPEAHMTSKAEYAMHQRFGGSDRSVETIAGNAEGLIAFANAITYLTSRPEAPEEAA